MEKQDADAENGENSKRPSSEKIPTGNKGSKSLPTSIIEDHPFASEEYAKKVEARRAKIHKARRLTVAWTEHEPEPKSEKSESPPPPPPPPKPEPTKIASAPEIRQEAPWSKIDVSTLPRGSGLFFAARPAAKQLQRESITQIQQPESQSTTEIHQPKRQLSERIFSELHKDSPKLNVIQKRKKTKARMKVLRLNQSRANKLFGTESKLANIKYNLILQLYRRRSSNEQGRSISSGASDGPDLSWLRQFSDRDFLDTSEMAMRKEYRPGVTEALFSAFGPTWYLMILLGRMPFTYNINIKTGFVNVKFRRKSSRFITFCLTSLLLMFVFVTSTINCFLIYDEYAGAVSKYIRTLAAGINDSDQLNSSIIHPYLTLEVLHLEKHGFTYVNIMTCFLFTIICDIYIMVRGERVAFMISNALNTCVSFKLDGSKWIWTTCSCLQGCVLLGLIGKLIIYIQLYSNSQYETNALITMSTTRWIPDLRYVRTNLDIYPSVGAALFLIQLYNLQAAYFHILLPSLVAIVITNIAAHWNFRLGLILGRIKATSKRAQAIKSSLSYEYMLKHHYVIRDLIRNYSLQSYATIIIAFYGMMIFLIITVLYRLARLSGIEFDKNSSVVVVPQATLRLLKFEYANSTAESLVNTLAMLLFFVTSLFTFNEILGKVGQRVMNGGFFHIRRHGLLGCKTPQEKRFVASLYEAFAARNPLWISPFHCFDINRRFFIVIFNTILIIFTTMVQAGRSRALVTKEIYGLCNTGICIIGQVRVNDDGISLEAFNANMLQIVEEMATPPPLPPPPPVTAIVPTLPPVTAIFPTFPPVTAIVPTLPPVTAIFPTFPPVTAIIPTPPPVTAILPPFEVSCPELKEAGGIIWALTEYCYCFNAVDDGLESIYLPVLCTGAGEFRPPYGLGVSTAGCHSSTYNSRPYTFIEYLPTPPMPDEVTNCNRMGHGLTLNFKVISDDRDDCGQLAIHDPLEPKPVLRQVEVRPRTGRRYMCCCYDYSWYKTDGSKPNLATNNCGLVNDLQRVQNCPPRVCFNSISVLRRC